MTCNSDSTPAIEQLETIFRLLHGFFYRCQNDANFTCLFLTSGFKQITGRDAEAFLGAGGRQFASLAHAADREAIDLAVSKAITARTPWAIEYRLVTSDGGTVWVRENGSGIFDDSGELLFLEGAIIDINQQKLGEAKLELYLERSDEVGAELMSIVDSVLSKLRRLDMLSMNARIEAVRGGEASSGFGAVAAEIKQLSESTKEDAGKLQDMVSQFKSIQLPRSEK